MQIRNSVWSKNGLDGLELSNVTDAMCEADIGMLATSLSNWLQRAAETLNGKRPELPYRAKVASITRNVQQAVNRKSADG